MWLVPRRVRYQILCLVTAEFPNYVRAAAGRVGVLTSAWGRSVARQTGAVISLAGELYPCEMHLRTHAHSHTRACSAAATTMWTNTGAYTHTHTHRHKHTVTKQTHSCSERGTDTTWGQPDSQTPRLVDTWLTWENKKDEHSFKWTHTHTQTHTVSPVSTFLRDTL